MQLDTSFQIASGRISQLPDWQRVSKPASGPQHFPERHAAAPSSPVTEHWVQDYLQGNKSAWLDFQLLPLCLTNSSSLISSWGSPHPWKLDAGTEFQSSKMCRAESAPHWPLPYKRRYATLLSTSRVDRNVSPRVTCGGLTPKGVTRQGVLGRRFCVDEITLVGSPWWDSCPGE